MRKNEFKLRQNGSSTKPIPSEYRNQVSKLLGQNVSKKAICVIFGCSYEHLKECR